MSAWICLLCRCFRLFLPRRCNTRRISCAASMRSSGVGRLSVVLPRFVFLLFPPSPVPRFFWAGFLLFWLYQIQHVFPAFPRSFVVNKIPFACCNTSASSRYICEIIQLGPIHKKYHGSWKYNVGTPHPWHEKGAKSRLTMYPAHQHIPGILVHLTAHILMLAECQWLIFLFRLSFPWMAPQIMRIFFSVYLNLACLPVLPPFPYSCDFAILI